MTQHRQGMSTVLMVVVTAVVLLMTALTIMFITQGGLSNFLSTAQAKSGEGVCISKQNTYCTTHPNGKWDSTSYKYQEKTCKEILGYKNDYYDCKEGKTSSSPSKQGKPSGRAPPKGSAKCTDFCNKLRGINNPDLKQSLAACYEINSKVTTDKIEGESNPESFVKNHQQDIVEHDNCKCSNKIITCFEIYRLKAKK